MKAVRELGSKRRKPVWFFSVFRNNGPIRKSSSTKGPEGSHPWCTGCSICCTAGQLSAQAVQLKASEVGKLCTDSPVEVALD